MATLRELRGQFTLFLMSGGLAASLLEGSRRFASEPTLAALMRHGAVAVLALGCAVAGIAMLAVAIGERRQPAVVLSRPRRGIQLPNWLRIGVGALLGAVVPVALLMQALA